MGKSSHRSRSSSRTSVEKSVEIVKKRRHSSSSDRSYDSPISKKRSKKSGKKKKRSSSSSSTSSSSSGESVRKRKKKSKRKEEKKRKKDKKKRKKKLKKEKRKKNEAAAPAALGPNIDVKPVDVPCGTSSPPIGPGEDLASKAKAMAPMTKEEWEKRQSVVKRVFDEETGRYRLIKGDGEVLEEIVSRDRHREINKQATRGDGAFFQAKLNLQR